MSAKSYSEKLYNCIYNPAKLEHIKELLDKKADPNVSNDYNFTILHWFATENKIEYVKLLLEYKAEAYSHLNYFPVHSTVTKGYSDMATLLIKNKGNTNVSDRDGISTLMEACSMNDAKVVDCLIKHGAKINETSYKGDTALTIACDKNNYEAAKILLENKANVNSKTNDGISSLNYACKNNNTKMVELLIEYKAHFEPDSKLLNLTKKNPKITEILIRNGATYTNSDYKAVLQALYENNTDQALKHLKCLNLNLEEHGILYEIAIEKENDQVIEYFREHVKY